MNGTESRKKLRERIDRQMEALFEVRSLLRRIEEQSRHYDSTTRLGCIHDLAEQALDSLPRELS